MLIRAPPYLRPALAGLFSFSLLNTVPIASHTEHNCLTTPDIVVLLILSFWTVDRRKECLRIG